MRSQSLGGTYLGSLVFELPPEGAVAELADALDLGSSTVRCGGSSPLSPIIYKKLGVKRRAFFMPI